MDDFYRELPKVELHAHLNGSLSHSTILELKRYHADAGLEDKTNVFFNEFQIAAGDSVTLSECFQLFGVAHSLTTTPEALTLATTLTLQEFQNDGCSYIELRSSPRETPHMTRRQYVEAIVQAMIKATLHLTIIPRLIISIDRRCTRAVAEEISALAVEFFKLHPYVVVGIELSGEPCSGRFEDFIPALESARKAGLKVTLHCGEVSNPEELLAMLNFKPDRIGHGTCIHPRLGGTQATWDKLCTEQIPVEVCLTSNVKTKSVMHYEDNHFKEMYEANIPVVLCTDDKGVFATSLSQEYRLCAETFNLTRSQMARLSLNACQHVFSEDVRKTLNDKLLNFIDKYEL